MQQTEDKTPSVGEIEDSVNKDIPEGMIPLSQGLKEYFGEGGMADNIRHTLTMDMQRYLYGKGIFRLHEVFVELEGRVMDVPNVIRNRDDSTLEELIDTIAEEMNINAGTFKHSLIAMVLKE